MRKIIGKKVLIAVSMGLALVAAGCSKQDADSQKNAANEVTETEAKSGEITYEQMLEANSRSSVFARHKNVYSEDIVFYEPDDELGQMVGNCGNISFLTEDLAYYETDYTGFGLEYDKINSLTAGSLPCWKAIGGKKDGELHEQWFAGTEEEHKAFFQSADQYQIMTEVPLEVIRSQNDNGDGTKTVYTELPMQAAFSALLPERFKGAVLQCEYMLDADSLEVKSLHVDIKTDSGIVNYLEQRHIYDADAPAGLAELRDFVNMIETKSYKNPRRVTFIYDYGTADEQSFTKEAGEEYLVDYYLREGYASYADPEKKEPFAGNPELKDTTIYAFKAEN